MQGAKQRRYERFSGPAPEDLRPYFFHRFICTARQRSAKQGYEEGCSVKNWVPSDIFHILASIITSGYIWLGIACLLTFFVAYMLVLTWADYSYVQPASSFSYAVVAMLGYFLLGEAVPPLRWIGIFVICVGVFIVGHTHPRTTEKA
jgi:hypothetical protein